MCVNHDPQQSPQPSPYLQCLMLSTRSAVKLERERTPPSCMHMGGMHMGRGQPWAVGSYDSMRSNVNA